jgi:YfiR/HmsC-like
MNDGRHKCGPGWRRGTECSWRAVRRLFAGLLILALPAALQAETQPHSEFRVKAAFVFNLTKYVEWPAARDHLVIVVVGEGPIVETLKDELNGKVSDTRTITVLVNPPDEELRRCDLLYVASSSGAKIDSILRRASTAGLLTVGDASSFTRQGGMVGLVTVGDRVEIQVNLEASRRANLKISSRLLNLAMLVSSSLPERSQRP